jgi:hypothetical protein
MDYESAQALVDEISRDPNIPRSAIRLGQLYTERPEVFEALHNREIAPGVRKNNPGPDASHTAAKLVRNAQAATQDYVRGMQNPRRDPKTAAVAAKGKWAERLQQAIQNDSYGKAVARYDLGEAVAIATGDGGAAFASGIAKRQAKIERVHAQLMPQLGAISQRIQSLPQDNEGQRTQRMIQNLESMRALGRARKGGGSGV